MVEDVELTIRDAADILDIVKGLSGIEIEGMFGLDLLRRAADLEVSAIVAETEGKLI